MLEKLMPVTLTPGERWGMGDRTLKIPAGVGRLASRDA